LKGLLLRALLVFLLTVGSFIAQGLTVVRPNEISVLTYRTLPAYQEEMGYIAEPGIYLTDPFAERITLKSSIRWPTTRDYLDAALLADGLRDFWYEEEGPQNPQSKEEVLQMVEDVKPYINAYTEAIGRPVAVDEVVFFWPEKGSGRYDLPIAYYCYIRRHIAVNMAFFREYMRGDDSFLATLVHEMSHSALNFMTGESLCQLLTLQVLYDMAEDGYPGARFAFWDELRSWFICAARYRVYYNHGWRALSIGQARAIGQELRWYHEKQEERLPVGWATHDFGLYLPSIGRQLYWALTGHPYILDLESLDRSPFVALTKAVVNWEYGLRVEGFHIRPARLLRKMGVSYGLLRRIFGPNYWSIDWAIVRGERDDLDFYLNLIYKGEYVHKREFEAKLREDFEHFAPIWWEYLYGPLQVIEMKGAGMPCRYVTWTTDINDILAGGDFAIILSFYFGFGAKISEMTFEDVGPVIWRLLDVKLTPQVERREGGYEEIVPFIVEMPPEQPRVRVFPTAPLVGLVVVSVDWKLRKRRWNKAMKELLWHYFINVCIAVDQFFNALFFGDPDETISSRLGKFKNRVAPYGWICWLLDFIDPGHCEKAIEPDEGKDQLAPFKREEH